MLYNEKINYLSLLSLLDLIFLIISTKKLERGSTEIKLYSSLKESEKGPQKYQLTKFWKCVGDGMRNIIPNRGNM